MITPILLATALLMGPTEPDTTLRLPRGGQVEIESHMRSITLRSHEGDLVTVRGGSVELDGRTMSVSVEDRVPTTTGTLEVTVPVWARVSISSLNGNVVIEGVPAYLQAESFNGSIRTTGGTGRLELETVTGEVTVNDFRGTHLNIDATGDNVTVDGATGRLEVSSVNGAVRLRGIRSSHVEATTVTGPVEFEGPLSPDGHYSFESHTGSITLTLPADVSARMAVSTFGGDFKSQIPALRPADASDNDPGDFTVVLGKGAAARVTVESFNGSIRINRAGAR
ncbi:MAG: DUF4097 family beta strand repeat-containing protein [Gemmatimonadota bacterium]